jgi:hypothetical protein
MKKKPVKEEDVKPDIKHDTMEFSPSNVGEDKLDIDDENYEEEEITAEELDTLEDKPDNEAYALNQAEMDREADEDNLPDEDWTEDLGDIKPDLENK